MKLELNELVVIVRGGIDGFPSVSLDGIVGRICSTHANALPGMVSVWVDWSKTRYADVEGLPNVINNFPADLAPPAPPKKPRPTPFVFTLPTLHETDAATDTAPSDSAPSDSAPSDSAPSDSAPDEDEKPRLRLV